eukprot:1158701-Pelagomonas_calceolata.AAC.8
MAAVADGAALLRMPAKPRHGARVVAARGDDLGLSPAGHAVLALAACALEGHCQWAGPGAEECASSTRNN